MAYQYGIITLTKEKIALIDMDDAEKLMKYGWHFARNKYAAARIDGEYVYMHRYLIDAPKGMQVDHINGDYLDNRKENLRLATNSQNQANKTKLKNNTSGYKGVWFAPRNKNKWVASIWHQDKKYNIGSFPTREDAAYAYNQVAIQLFREYAETNVIGGQNG